MPLRKDILAKASELTCGSREEEYGPPYVNLSNCALLVTAYLVGKYGSAVVLSLTPEDIAWINVLQKIARTYESTAGQDTYVDAAAYSAMAGECHNIQTKGIGGSEEIHPCPECKGVGYHLNTCQYHPNPAVAGDVKFMKAT